MKVKWSERKSKAQTIFYYCATILVILAIIGFLFDFISWKDAVGLIKSKIPINASLSGSGTSVVSDMDYSPLSWRGSLRGRVYLFSDEDLDVEQRSVKIDNKILNIDGTFDGTIPKVSGVTLYLHKISNPNNPLVVSYGKTILKNRKGEYPLEMWVYLLDKGQKEYKKVFAGYKPIDYPITRSIVATYKRQIDPDNTITEDEIDWLCTFTRDSLHRYVISFFEQNKVPELFKKPNIYAYRLDQEISSVVKWQKTYKKVWTKKRKKACIGIIYKFNNKTYVRVIYDAWYIGCRGGGFVFNFWH